MEKKLWGEKWEKLGVFSEHTPVYRYLHWLETFLEKAESDKKDYAVYREAVEAGEKIRQTSHPFLSVITRTQGKRPQELQEVFLCLGAQTDMDFEVVLIGHKLSEEQKKDVEVLVSRQPEELRNRIRFLQLDYGTRTTPLNYGFAHAYGDYAAILDDDDLIFDNWVEAFHKTAEKKSGTILHSYCFEQDWNRLKNEKMEGALRAVGRPKAEYCNDFFVVRELYMNECPPVCMAFPLNAYRNLGLYFDETLNTTEDWDYIMRVAFVCGVSDTKEASCIYRYWTNAENSHTIHGEDEWKKNYTTIQKKFDEFPVLLAEGDVSRVSHVMKELDDFEWVKKNTKGEAEYLVDRENGQEETERNTRWESALYFDCGDGYKETQKEIIDGIQNEIGGKYRFYWTPSESKRNLHEIRWDPTELAGLIVEDCEIKLLYDDKTEQALQGKKLLHNGYMYEDKLLFPLNDPWFVIPIAAKSRLCKIVIEVKMQQGISSAMMQALLPKQRLKKMMSRF